VDTATLVDNTKGLRRVNALRSYSLVQFRQLKLEYENMYPDYPHGVVFALDACSNQASENSI
jgi:hypothetical protein